jgi:hypothetical protein
MVTSILDGHLIIHTQERGWYYANNGKPATKWRRLLRRFMAGV